VINKTQPQKGFYKEEIKMKKLLIIAALATMVSGVFADDLKVGDTTINYGKPTIGARYNYNWDSNQNVLGLTLGTKWDKIGVEGSFDRSTTGDTNVNQWGLIGSYDVYKFQGATIALKGGAAYVMPAGGDNGWFGIVGAGVSYPVAPNLAVVGDYSYQNGSSAVAAYNGNVVSVGVKYSF